MKFQLTVALCVSTVIASAQSIQDGIKATENERYNYATGVFSNLIKVNPNDVDAIYYLGAEYLVTGKIDLAKATFSKGIAAAPQNPLNYIGIGKTLLAEGKKDEAQIQLDKAASLIPKKDEKTWTLLAEAYISTDIKDAGKALEILNSKALAADPKYAPAYLAKGDAYISQNNGGDAVSSYEKAVELNKNFPKALWKTGKIWVNARNYDAALESFNKAIALDSTFAPVYKDLGELYRTQNKFDLSIAAYKKYIAQSEKTVTNLSRLATLMFIAKDYQGVIATVNEVTKMDSSNAALKRYIAYSYYEKGEYAKGLEFMEKFFAKVDKQKIIGDDYEYYGRLQIKTGKDSLGIISLQKALEMEPTMLELNGEIAKSLFDKRKYADAGKYFEKYIAGGKNVTLADYFYLGKCYFNIQAYGKADTAFNKIVELKPTYAMGYYQRAQCNIYIAPDGKSELAKTLYEKFIQLVPDPVKNKKELIDAYSYLGKYSIQADDNVNAKIYLQKVIELDPENKEAKEILKRLK